MAPGFSMQHPLDISRMNEPNSRPGMNEAWAIEQQQQMRVYEDSAKASWATEFGQTPQANLSIPQMQQGVPGRSECTFDHLNVIFMLLMIFPVQQRTYMQPMYGSSMPMGMYGMNAPSMQYPMNSNFIVADQGKGKAREADFEAAFAQIVESLGTTESQTSRIEEVDDSVTEIQDALKNVSLKAGEVDGEQSSDFQKYVNYIMVVSPNSQMESSRVWDQLQNSDLPPPKEDIAKWEAEFSQLMNAQRDELEDYGNNMQTAWEGGIGNYDENFGEAIKFDGEGIPLLGDYVFGKIHPGDQSSVNLCVCWQNQTISILIHRHHGLF